MLSTYLKFTMKRTLLRPKKFYTLKKSPIKVKKIYTLKKTELKVPEDYELKKQNEKKKEKWEEARQECIRRYKGKCVVCGKPGTQVHHIHLRSKRPDLLLNQNNLVLVCDKHHFHQGSDKYELQCEILAMALHITVEELLKRAEQKEE